MHPLVVIEKGPFWSPSIMVIILHTGSIVFRSIHETIFKIISCKNESIFYTLSYILIMFAIWYIHFRCTCDVMVIIVKNEHRDPSSNPGQDFVFHIALIPLRKV